MNLGPDSIYEGLMGLKLQDWENSVELMPGFCVIEPHKPPEQQGSIILPDKAQDDQSWGRVVLMGEPKVPGHDPGFEVNDWVIYSRWAGAAFETDDRKDLTLMRQEDILAVILGD